MPQSPSGFWRYWRQLLPGLTLGTCLFLTIMVNDQASELRTRQMKIRVETLISNASDSEEACRSLRMAMLRLDDRRARVIYFRALLELEDTIEPKSTAEMKMPIRYYGFYGSAP